MAKHLCPYGHAAVVRQDPDSTGLLGMCDFCGWSAAYTVAREQGDWHAPPAETPQLNAGAPEPELPPTRRK
jgi:hypothetical protein